MSIPTVNALAQVMMREFGEDISDASLVSQVEAWIQDVFDEISVNGEWKYLYKVNTVNTVNGTRLYELSDVMSQELSCRITSDDTPLIKRDRSIMVQLGRDLELTGRPSDWYIETYNFTTEKMSLGLWPVPNAVFSLEFYAILVPTELVSATKLPFPREFIFLLKDGVRIKFKEDDKDYSGADRIRLRFDKALAKLKANNDSITGLYPQMQIQDIGYSRQQYVRLPPNHFSN